MARPAPDQPERFDSVYAKLEWKTDSIDYRRLFGDSCWTYSDDLPVRARTGYHEVTDEPEYMVLDTLKDMLVDKGLYGDYIPWRERETYQSTLTVTGFYAKPRPIVQKLLIRVFVRGIQYLWQTEGTLAGLSKGHYLVDDYNTEDPALMYLDDWHLQVVNDSLGYIYTTVNTFGLRPSTIDGYYSVHNGEYKAPETRAEERADVDSIWWVDALPKDLRLNLRFTLRDHSRVMEYQYEVGDQVVKFDNELTYDLTPHSSEGVCHDELVVASLYHNNLRYTAFGKDGQALMNLQNEKIAPIHGADYVEDEYFAQIKQWYWNRFLIFGSQIIQNSTQPKPLRTAFYLQKVQYD